MANFPTRMQNASSSSYSHRLSMWHFSFQLCQYVTRLLIFPASDWMRNTDTGKTFQICQRSLNQTTVTDSCNKRRINVKVKYIIHLFKVLTFKTYYWIKVINWKLWIINLIPAYMLLFEINKNISSKSFVVNYLLVCSIQVSFFSWQLNLLPYFSSF